MQFNTDLFTNIVAVSPEILIVLLGALVLYIDVAFHESQRRQAGYWAGIGMLLIALVPIVLTAFVPTAESAEMNSDVEAQLVLGGMLRFDNFTLIFRSMIYAAAGLSCLIAMGDNRLRYKGEFYLILMVASIGAGLMGGAADLVMVFVALETLSILMYALAGFIRITDDDEAASRSAESGLKYFMLGSFSSGFTLYGFSLIFGFTGETNLYAIGQAFSVGALSEPPIILALLMVSVGFAFKISAVPFHFWTPDVYEGSPTAMTAYVSVASKAASFALVTRFLLAVFPPADLLPASGQSYTHLWIPVVVLLATLSMTLGNVLALVQHNIKRLLAYSSIAQAGYTLVGLAAISTTTSGTGAAAVAFYMFMYVFTNILAFGCILVFTNATGSEEIADMAGLGRRNRNLALMMAVALLSLAGIPPAAGFFGKFFIFLAAVDAGMALLAIVVVLNSIIALYYYLEVIKVMFFDETPADADDIVIPGNYSYSLGFATVLVIGLGTVLVPFLNSWTSEAGLNLFEVMAQLPF